MKSTFGCDTLPPCLLSKSVNWFWLVDEQSVGADLGIFD